MVTGPPSTTHPLTILFSQSSTSSQHDTHHYCHRQGCSGENKLVRVPKCDCTTGPLHPLLLCLNYSFTDSPTAYSPTPFRTWLIWYFSSGPPRPAQHKTEPLSFSSFLILLHSFLPSTHNHLTYILHLFILHLSPLK